MTKRPTVGGYRRRLSKTAGSSEPEARAPGVLWIDIDITVVFAVGGFVGRERHGSLALAAWMSTDFPRKGFHIESKITGFRPIIQDFLAKCTVNPDENVL